MKKEKKGRHFKYLSHHLSCAVHKQQRQDIADIVMVMGLNYLFETRSELSNTIGTLRAASVPC